MRKIAGALLASYVFGLACTGGVLRHEDSMAEQELLHRTPPPVVKKLQHIPPMVEQIQDDRLTTQSNTTKQQQLREVTVDGKTYALKRTSFDFVLEKNERIAQSEIGSISLAGKSWHEDFTYEAVCGEFFNYRASDGKELDAFIIAFANGDVKVYLFREDGPVAFPYTAKFSGGTDCSVKIRREGTKTLFEITGTNGRYKVYDLKDGEL